MKKSLISFSLAILFMGILYYLSIYFSPFDQEEIQKNIEIYRIESNEEFEEYIYELLDYGLIVTVLDTQNVSLWLFIFGCMVVNIIASLHLFIDKLFYKKFFEDPSLFDAYRRGTLIYLFIVSIIILKFYAGLLWYNVFAITILLIAIDRLFASTQTKES
jgi:hypothetical protein